MGDHRHHDTTTGVVAADWLHGRLRRGSGRVVGAGPRAAYVEVQSQDHAGPPVDQADAATDSPSSGGRGDAPGGAPGGAWMLAIEDHRGVGLPCGVRLPAADAPVLARIRTGMQVTVACDVVAIATSPSTRLRVVRWHRCRPSVAPPEPDEVAARLVTLLGTPAAEADPGFRRHVWWQDRWPGLDPVLARGVRDLVGLATRSGPGDPAGVVARLLGHGPGSTPSGDDLVAGFVATGLLLDPVVRHAAAGVAAAMLTGRRARTTLLSATLLACAADGAMAMPAAGFLQVALAPATTADRIDAAFDHLARIGHTSGRDLALGIVGALHAHVAVTAAAGSWPAPGAGSGTMAAGTTPPTRKA